MSAVMWGVPVGGGVIQLRTEANDAAVVVMVLKVEHDQMVAGTAELERLAKVWIANNQNARTRAEQAVEQCGKIILDMLGVAR